MFLWVKFQIEEICECLTSLEIREALQDLPKDLATLYARILSRLQKSHGATAYAAFRWIVCAHRPLDTQELFEAIAIEESDDHFHWDRVISDSNKFLRACGNLVAIQLDGTVRLAHETVKQFLLQNHPRDAGQDSERDYSEEVRRLKFSFEEADNWIGRQCIAYLLFSEFESQVIAIKRPRLEIPTATFMPLIGGSLDELPKGKISLVLPGRGRKKQIDKHQAQFKILSYLQEFWILHLRHITEDSLGPYRHDFKKRVLQVAFTREYLFPIRPWEQPSYLNSFAYNHACEVIKNDARATHIPLFIWTLEHEVYYLHEILQSAEIQFREMMIFLLQYDKRRHKTLLRYAAEFGPTQVRVIMKYLEKINQTLDVGISVHMNDLVGALQWPSESTQMSLLASLRKAPSAQTDSEGTCFPIAHMWDSVPFPKKDYNWRQYCYDHFQHVVYGLFEKSFHDLFNSDVPLEITTLRPKVTVLRFLLQQLPDIDLSPEWLVKGCLSRILDDRIQIRFFQALVFHLENILSPELKNYLGKAALDWVFTFQAAWHCSPVPGKIKDELWIKLSDFYDHLQWEEDELPQKSRGMETFQMLLKDGATASSIEESIKATWPYPVRPDLQKRLDEFLGELDTILFAC
ncbi:uncharacterized protein BKA78DRAFT_37251 [Phyllosticta capitalensis]|uniref:uncharacterized protein n=1 Tax=Phyllosticta capitalensis TaxID=121624 RepID=UPI00312F4868